MMVEIPDLNVESVKVADDETELQLITLTFYLNSQRYGLMVYYRPGFTLDSGFDKKLDAELQALKETHGDG